MPSQKKSVKEILIIISVSFAVVAIFTICYLFKQEKKYCFKEKKDVFKERPTEVVKNSEIEIEISKSI